MQTLGQFVWLINNFWERLMQRRPYSVVVAALANKLASTAWAVLAKGKDFDQVMQETD
jgi:hypothetical protein